MRENGGRERGAEGGGRGKVPLRSGVGVNNEICCDGEAAVSRLSRGNRRASVLVALSSNSGLLDVLFFSNFIDSFICSDSVILIRFFHKFYYLLVFCPEENGSFFLYSPPSAWVYSHTQASHTEMYKIPLKHA